MKIEQLLIIGAIGVGAYMYFGPKGKMTQASRAQAAQPTVTGQPNKNNWVNDVNAITGLVGGLAGLFQGGGVPQTPSFTGGGDSGPNFYQGNLDIFAMNPPSSYSEGGSFGMGNSFGGLGAFGY